jgi:hypothetical protein
VWGGGLLLDSKLKKKNTDFKNTMILKVLRDLSFSQKRATETSW